jgi:hypothetical protein
MEVSGRHARTRAVIRGTVLAANRTLPSANDASRDVARVVSDVSVLCPRGGAWFDNIITSRLQGGCVGGLWPIMHEMAGNAAVDRKSTQPRPPKLRTIGYQALALIEVSDLAQDDREDRAELRLGADPAKRAAPRTGRVDWIG